MHWTSSYRSMAAAYGNNAAVEALLEVPLEESPSIASLLSQASSEGLATLPAVARAVRHGRPAEPPPDHGKLAPLSPQPPAEPPRRPRGADVDALRAAPPGERDRELHRLAALHSAAHREDGALSMATYQGRLLPQPASTRPRRLGRASARSAAPLTPSTPLAPLTARIASGNKQQAPMEGRWTAGSGPGSARAQQRREVLAHRLQLLRTRLKSMSYGNRRSGQSGRNLFERYDRDNSGALNVAEFTRAVRTDGHLTEAMCSDRELAALFRSIDRDQSGSVEIGELVAFVWGDGGGRGEEATQPTRLACEGSHTLASWRATMVPAVASHRRRRAVAASPRATAAAAAASPRATAAAAHPPLTGERQAFGTHPTWSRHERPHRMVNDGSFAFWFLKTGDPFVRQLY